MAHQVGDGGFAVGAGDADPGHAAAGLKGQLHVASNADALLPQFDQGGVVPADARTHHHAFGGGGESGESLGAQGGAELNRYPQLAQFGGFGGKLGAGLAFDHQHGLAEVVQQLGGPHARASQPNNHGQIVCRESHLPEMDGCWM